MQQIVNLSEDEFLMPPEKPVHQPHPQHQQMAMMGAYGAAVPPQPVRVARGFVLLFPLRPPSSLSHKAMDPNAAAGLRP